MKHWLIVGAEGLVSTIGISILAAGVYLFYNAEYKSDALAARESLKVELRQEFESGDKELEQRIIRELDRLNRNIEQLIEKRGK